VKLQDLCTSLEYVFAMQATSLDDLGSGLDVDALHRLHNPPTYPASFDGDRSLEAAIKLYIGLNHAGSDYHVTRETFMSFNSLDNFPSYYQVKKKMFKPKLAGSAQSAAELLK